MPNLKDIQLKIAAVKKTQQITKAMNMVAASRLRGAQEAVERFRPYADKFKEVLADLAIRVEPDVHPFFRSREEVTKAAVICLTSDRGLCGSFNINLINKTGKLMNELKERDVETMLICAGKKGRDHFNRRNTPAEKAYLDVVTKPDMVLAREISDFAIDAFLTGEVDEVYVVWSEFINMVKLIPTVTKLLPLSPEDLIGEQDIESIDASGEYLVEPSPGEVMIDLLPKNVAVQIFSALLETSCSSYAASMTAMENATKNCKELIQDLTLAFNKARQAAITTELMDIVGGAEALKQ